MLPGSSLLARLAGRPRPQWGRLVVRYAAPLYEERSESRWATVIPPSKNKKMLTRVFNLLKKRKKSQRKLGSLEHAFKQVKYY